VNTTENEPRLEYASLEDLVEMEKTKLQEVLPRAYKSPFYRDRWRAIGLHPDRVHGLEDLHLLQFVPRNELFEVTRRKRSKIVCSPVDVWFAGSSPANPYEWFPFSAKDFLGIAPMLARMGRVIGLRTGDIVLAITEAPPRISSVISYLWTSSEVSIFPRLEFITASLDWYDTLAMTWINFIQRRRPTVLFTSTKNALALADKIHRDFRVQAREILTETRVGIFFGEPLGDDKAKIMEAYTLEPYEVYSPTEHMSFCTECSAHQGIHLWMDTCIPEIIPIDRKDAIPIWETSPGTTGELVITNFAECLPLIRYKTGESISVQGINPCACGRTPPRITRLPKPAMGSGSG
jgi:phenylacetate-CoA ligase